nr:hypothetical protein CFP56_73950 [Quercus suber]
MCTAGGLGRALEGFFRSLTLGGTECQDASVGTGTVSIFSMIAANETYTVHALRVRFRDVEGEVYLKELLVLHATIVAFCR